AGYGVYPTYYRAMFGINHDGPRILGEIAPLAALSVLDAHARMSNGIALIDGRYREAFAQEHIPGALNIEVDESFGTYVGWLLPFNAPLLVLIDEAAVRHEAQIQLLRIGYERIEGYLDGGIAAWVGAGYPTRRFRRIDVLDIAQMPEGTVVLDVRRDEEWRMGH